MLRIVVIRIRKKAANDGIMAGNGRLKVPFTSITIDMNISLSNKL